MNEKNALLLASLTRARWEVEVPTSGWKIPDDVLRRYSWIPQDLWELAESTSLLLAPSEKCWILTGADYCGESELEFTWDEWERFSLDAADNDPRLTESIRAFWDSHLPVAMSVADGYTYFAVERESLRIVYGEETAFEEPSRLTDSLASLIEMLAAGDPQVKHWL